MRTVTVASCLTLTDTLYTAADGVVGHLPELGPLRWETSTGPERWLVPDEQTSERSTLTALRRSPYGGRLAVPGAGQAHLMSKTSWTKEAAARAQAAAARNPAGANARDGLDRKAQSQADKHEYEQE
ncbi:hypothetical protein ACFYY8_17640 [Streptosporangium sp. NPDC001559]|uniref:hypothetical protein n=1 Tax=Streptosporangium sp. NPDC001559 TaxID=3366187 RepID=UPI0036EEB9B9